MLEVHVGRPLEVRVLSAALFGAVVVSEAMAMIKFVHWQEADGTWMGYLQDYPDYWTQGESFDDLKAQLLDLYQDVTSGQIPGIRKVDDLVIS